ncbi:MAG: hypothetical protein V8T45_11785, partial [Oscillospiraceae bacterium]
NFMKPGTGRNSALSSVFMLSIHKRGGSLELFEHAYKIAGIDISQLLSYLHNAVVAAAKLLLRPLYFFDGLHNL